MIGFHANGNGRAQIALQVGKLPSKASVERERKAWKAALARLEKLLE